MANSSSLYLVTLHWFYEPAKYSILSLLSTAFVSGWIEQIKCFQFFLSLKSIRIDSSPLSTTATGYSGRCGSLWESIDILSMRSRERSRHGQWCPPLLLPRKWSCITQSLLFHAMHTHWSGGELMPFDSRRWLSWPVFLCVFRLPRPNPKASIRLLVTS